ncbi:MAG: DedA family protein [Acidimicrobiales bacterium]
MLTNVVDTLGDLGVVGLCLAVAFLAFSETAILLDLAVPGEVGLVLGGAAAASAGHPVVAVIAAAALGALAGDTLSYTVGRRWGRPLVERFRWTRRRLAPVVDRAEHHFAVHGGRSVFVGRWIGALRAVVPFVAGIGRLRVATFLMWNVAASISWATAVVLVGFWLGEPVAETVDRIGTLLSVAAVLVVGVAWWWMHRSRADDGPAHRGRSTGADGPPPGAH